MGLGMLYLISSNWDLAQLVALVKEERERGKRKRKEKEERERGKRKGERGKRKKERERGRERRKRRVSLCHPCVIVCVFVPVGGIHL